MRSTIIILLFAFLGLAGCAYEGKVVAKQFRPFPFPDSLGVDGIYKFQLRDQDGMTHSQLVTAQVFASYEVGDYFNDFGTPPVREGKDFKSIAVPYRNELQEPPVPYGPDPLRARQPVYQPYHPVRTASVQHHAKSAAKNIAAHHRHAGHATKVARTSHRKKHSTHVAQRRASKHHRHSSTT